MPGAAALGECWRDVGLFSPATSIHPEAAAVDGLLRYLSLAAHRIDRDNRPFSTQHQQFQQFRNRHDLMVFLMVLLIVLLIQDDLSKADGVGRGPDADHVDRRLAAYRIIH